MDNNNDSEMTGVQAGDSHPSPTIHITRQVVQQTTLYSNFDDLETKKSESSFSCAPSNEYI